MSASHPPTSPCDRLAYSVDEACRLLSIGRTSLYELAKREIARWYDVFYAWSRGLTTATEPIPRQIWDALTPDFRVVLTDAED